MVVARVEIFGGKSLAARWALPATPLQGFRPPIRRHRVICGCSSAEERDERETELRPNRQLFSLINSIYGLN